MILSPTFSAFVLSLLLMIDVNVFQGSLLVLLFDSFLILGGGSILFSYIGFIFPKVQASDMIPELKLI